jgi:hypothetical protein
VPAPERASDFPTLAERAATRAASAAAERADFGSAALTGSALGSLAALAAAASGPPLLEARNASTASAPTSTSKPLINPLYRFMVVVATG